MAEFVLADWVLQGIRQNRIEWLAPTFIALRLASDASQDLLEARSFGFLHPESSDFVRALHICLEK